MNPSFIRDYQGCDVVVEATFLTTGTGSFMLGSYDTSANATFQVLVPGSSPQVGFGGSPQGIFAGVPKMNADILFGLKQGEIIKLRGAPWAYFYGKTLVTGVFQANSITRK